MIPSTFFEGPSPNTLPTGFSSGNGGAARTGEFADILGRATAGNASDRAEAGCGKSVSDGQSFLDRLKKECMASGHSLEDDAIDEDGLAEFGNILVNLGFDADEVEEMLSAFSSRAVGKGVTLADLFGAASQLSEPGDDGSALVLLDVSAMADLENILTGLGLDLETSRDILSDALVEGKGFDLGILAAGIRSAMGDAGTVIENPAGVLESMRRIGLLTEGKASLAATLDELISEVTRLRDAQALEEDSDESDGIAGSLLLSYLQQLADSLGEDGSELRQLIASVENENGGIDADALLSKLTQLRLAAASTGSSLDMAGTLDTGDINLDRFAALLEERIAAADGMRGAAKAGPASRSMAEMAGGFMENVSPASESSSERLVLPVDPEGDGAFQKSWQSGAKRLSNSNRHSDTAAKDGVDQNTAQASKQTLSTGGGQGLSSNSSGADSAKEFSEALNAVGKDKSSNTTEDSRLGTESLAREMKAGDSAASSGKTAAGRNLPGYLLNQVSRQIIRLRNAGEKELTLQLKPPHLGRMKLNIEHTSGGIRVGIVVESSAARDMLLANSHDLKASLSDQGLRLDRIDVEAQADFGQSMAQAGKGFDQSGNRKGRWAEGSRTDVGGVSENPVVTEPGVGGMESGRLDLVA